MVALEGDIDLPGGARWEKAHKSRADPLTQSNNLHKGYQHPARTAWWTSGDLISQQVNCSRGHLGPPEAENQVHYMHCWTRADHQHC